MSSGSQNIFSATVKDELGMIVGSIAGGYAPALFGLDDFTASIMGSIAGGLLGVWIAYRLS